MSLDTFRLEVQGFMNKAKHKMEMNQLERENSTRKVQEILNDPKYSTEYKNDQAQQIKAEMNQKKATLQNDIISTFQEAHELGKQMYKKAGLHSQEEEVRLLRKQMAQRDKVDDLIYSFQNSPAKLNILADKLKQAVNHASEDAPAYLRAYKRLTADRDKLEDRSLIEWAEYEVQKQSITDEQKEVTEIMDNLYRLKVEYEKDVIQEQIEEGEASVVERISLKNRLHELTHDLNLNGLAQDVYSEEEEEEEEV